MSVSQMPGVLGIDEKALLLRYLSQDFERFVAEAEKQLAAVDKIRRQTPEALTQRHELARQLVAGAWLNRNNPDWDPTKPETHRPDPGDPLVALMTQLESNS